MLSHANNTNRQSDISASAADEWLKQNPQRTSEHMTGKLAPDAVICKLRRSTDHACARPHPETQMVRKLRYNNKFQSIKKESNHE